MRGPASTQGGLSTATSLTQETTSHPLDAELASLRAALETVKGKFSGLHLVRSTLGGLEDCVACMQIGEQHRGEYEEVISNLIDLMPLLWRPFIGSNPRNVPQDILDTAASIKNKVKDIQGSQSHVQVRTEESEKRAFKRFRELSEKFQKLQVEISAWEKSREQWTDARLRDLLPTHEAYYNAALPSTVTKRIGCTENTRVGLLDDTRTWTRDKDGAKIFWLNGMAGTGKTTIAYTMCKWLQQEGRLAASFFCSRNSLECRDVNRIVPTIAYQLGQPGRYYSSYRHRLCNVFEEDAEVARRDISTQFKNLISKPLSAISEAMLNDMVVVIDALDECTDVHGAEVVLNMLLQHVENLPLKFFVTSRPEPAIIQRMTTGDGAMRSIIWLHDIDRSLVQADIRTYLAEALQAAQATPPEIEALAERAGCLFIFAATAVRYIIPDRGAVNHRQRLQTILNLRPRQGNKSHKDIDELYITILSNALDNDVFEEEELVIRQQVLWTVACASGPLSMVAIARLLGLSDAATVEVAIQPLQSVLRISENSNMVSTLHASFPDFLLSQERAGEFYRNEVLQNAYLAERCFQIMDQSLQFNICRLKSSYMLDQDVPDLQERVDRVISNELFYACRYWGDHLAKCPHSLPLMDQLDSFMRHHLLSWIEVLNLKKHLGHGDGVLGQALAWLLPQENSTDMQDFIHDARNFILVFTSSPASLSTPQVYISTLPFAPKQSRVWVTYWPRTQGLIRVRRRSIEARRNSALATWDIGNSVHCIAQSSDGKRIATCSNLEGWRGSHLGTPQAVNIWDASSGTRISGLVGGHNEPTLAVSFSPDNTHIASGSADQTVKIWDANDGHLIVGPLHGHDGPINSVSFSPDGACLASGSDDHTIRIWNAYTGGQLGEPLDGHRGSVKSIVFSPDCRHLASGSGDCTIRVWDSRTRMSMRAPFEGHTQSVNSIAYSYDALNLASGSHDQTVRVWEASGGTLLADPFRGHTDAVTSVSFSPNGGLVVSGSHDKTIRVWEAGTGVLLAGPFKGHIDRINSVHFTKDGTRILSGSKDGTIRVWDGRHKSTVAGEAFGHTSGIFSVALSSNGTHAASGSSDRTICVWDTADGTLIAGPLRGHSDDVRSVAFSPDGTRIVSGSSDCALRTWDASTGSLLAGPFLGHTDPVMAVTFSPDGNQVASGSDDGTIRVWNSYTGESFTRPFYGRHFWRVTSIAFSPSGARLVSGSHDRTVRMWGASDDTQPLWSSSAHTNWVNCVAFSPDGTQVASGSEDCTVLVLDASNGVVLHGPFTRHTERVLCVAFSPKGGLVLSGSGDRTVRVWDAHSGAMVATSLKGHASLVNSVVFFPDGRRAISGSADGAIRFWDISGATKSGPNAHHSLSVGHDGWVTSSKSKRLLWVPLDMRQDFELPLLPNSAIITGSTSSLIHNSTLYVGDQWYYCYPQALPPTV